MKKLFVFCLALMLAVLPMGMAMAETIMIYGTVINTQPQPVICTADGSIDQIHFTVGDRVSEGAVIATLATQKVYATTDGTVYLFGEPGDKISDIADQYGAVAYIAPEKPYTITATATDRNGVADGVLPGEVVFLRCYKDGKHTGKGILAKLEKGKYTVVVTEGEFANSETVSVYRQEDYADTSRIGRAKVDTAEMIACKGDGYLVQFHVANGAKVEKGTLLYETINGSFAPGSQNQNQITSPVNGIISAIKLENGSQLTGAAVAATAEQSDASNKSGNQNDKKDESAQTVSEPASQAETHLIAEIYPDANLRIVAYAPESVLNEIHVNDTVYVTCQYIENMASPVAGTVEKISRIPTPDANSVEAQYAVYITVEDASSFYYGMNVIVTTGGNN